MTSNIIPFRPRANTNAPTAANPLRSPEERLEQSPEWLRKHDISWIFEEAARRMDQDKR
ncbi:MAG: hypothetical protein ABJH52_11130 [Henriciella sp.]